MAYGKSYRQGTTALAADVLRHSRPLGFGLDQVTATVHPWHGEHGPKVPITTAPQRRPQPPPTATSTSVLAAGHLMACDRAGEILATLTNAFEPDAKEDSSAS
jgi:hypothetical protein